MSESRTTIPAEEALRRAQADAVQAYHDLTPYWIRVVLELDGWHVDYQLRSPGVKGGGPHYVIDHDTGAIIFKRYEQ